MEMENDQKLTIVKFYHATEDDWRNPDVYIDTDPSNSSCESENESVDEYHTPMNTRKNLFYKENIEGHEHDDMEPLVKLATLSVKSETTSEKPSNNTPRLSKLAKQSKSSDSITSSDSDDKTEKKKRHRHPRVSSLLETTARFARFPFRKYIWGRRNSSARKNTDKDEQNLKF